MSLTAVSARSLRCGLIVVSTFQFVSLAYAGMISIPVNCGGNQVGVISATNGATGLSGNFTTIPKPPNAGTLAAAATACGEDHFNWYQVVTADNQPPKNFAGQQLAAPYVDVPPQGYALAFDPTWADKIPWYYDEGPQLPAPGQNVNNALLLSSNTTNTTLSFSDGPNGPNGLSLSFSTWLVSLNKDSSFHAFEGGFSWTFDKSNTGVITVGAPVVLAGDPTNAQYRDIIGGFATSIPEPSTVALFAAGALALAGMRWKAKAA